MDRYSFIVMDLHHLSPAGLPALSVAQWLACASPYRRFVDTLTDNCARVGANVDRYSFIAVDCHHILLASLLALSKCGMIAGVLETQNENIRAVDSSVALVNVAIKENSKVIAQLRNEHGGYPRSIQMATEALDRLVTALEGRP